MPEQNARFWIRRATQADIPAILHCLGAAFEDYRDAYTQPAFLDTVLTPESIQQRLAKMSVFVAVHKADQIVGTVACNVMGRNEGHIRGMAVLPECHGAGIATQLLKRAESELKSRKCTHITLDTTEPLTRAMRFYEKNGFRRSGKVTDFFGMPLFEHRKTLTGDENK